MENIKTSLFHTIAAVFLAVFVSSCSGKPKAGKEIARVNDAPILLSEFQQEIAIASERNPSFVVNEGNMRDLLDRMIERRLMIGEARKKGLSEDERFLRTIKTYWEQTLIRELIDAKTKEWDRALYVSDDEIRAQYERMRHRFRIKYVKVEKEDEAHEAEERLKAGGRHEEEEESSILAEDVDSQSLLSNAFDMAAGEVRAFEENGRHVVVKVVSKEEQKIAPLDEIHDRIKQTLLESKRQRAVARWLDETKAKARIRVDEKTLKELTGPGHDKQR